MKFEAKRASVLSNVETPIKRRGELLPPLQKGAGAGGDGGLARDAWDGRACSAPRQIPPYNPPMTRSLPAWILLALPLLAVAQVNGTSDYLQRMDADRDGRVSQAEFLDWMSYAFNARDRDHDGVLSGDELPGGKGAAITRSTHREQLAATFRKQDRNGDGYLDARELAAPPR